MVWCVLGGLGWFGVFWVGLGCFHGPPLEPAFPDIFGQSISDHLRYRLRYKVVVRCKHTSLPGIIPPIIPWPSVSCDNSEKIAKIKEVPDSIL